MPTGAAKSVLAVDLDDDGDLEILAGGRVLAAWDPDGDPVAAAGLDGLLYNPIADSQIDTEPDLNIWGELAAGDVDTDGETEIAMLFGDGKLRMIDEDGSAHWSIPITVNARSTPTLADLDQDGDLEVILNGLDGGDLYVWHKNGTNFRTNNNRYVDLSLANQVNYSGVAVADVDSTSPGLEIAQSLFNGEVKLWKTQTGSGNPAAVWVKGPCDSPPCGGAVTTPAIADVNADDVPDVIVASKGTWRKAATFKGQTGGFSATWRGKNSSQQSDTLQYHWLHLPPDPMPYPAIAELDPSGNGVPEVFMGRGRYPEDRLVDVYDDHNTMSVGLLFNRGTVPSGEYLGRVTTLTDSVPRPGRLREYQGITRGNPILGDIDGDGRQELIVGSNHGALFAWEFTPTSGDSFAVNPEPGWPLQFSDLPCNPSFADLDQSGDTLQLIVGLEDGHVYVYDLPEMTADDVQWPTAQYDVARTGAYPNFWLESPRTPTSGGPSFDDRMRSGPNPFGPETAIRFRLRERGTVMLAVYDAGGREVKRLWSGELEAGRHEFEWNGRDDQNRRVASGVYFLKLSGASGTQTRRLVLAR